MVSAPKDYGKFEETEFQLESESFPKDKFLITSIGKFKIMYILRKYLERFLLTLSSMYNIFIYSHGEQRYI